MPRIDVRRTAVLLLLLFLLAPALGRAGERRSGPAPRQEAALLPGGLLSAVWGFLTGIWAREGSSLDSDGKPRTNEGGSLDPDGQPKTNAGSSLDPDGRA